MRSAVKFSILQSGKVVWVVTQNVSYLLAAKNFDGATEIWSGGAVMVVEGTPLEVMTKLGFNDGG